MGRLSSRRRILERLLNWAALKNKMEILLRLFGSDESIAKNAEKSDKELLDIWKKYLATIPEKKALFEKFRAHNDPALLLTLNKMLDHELVRVDDEQHEDTRLLGNLTDLEHSKKIMRVERLEKCLHYISTNHEYVHELLKELHACLLHQSRLLRSGDLPRILLEMPRLFELEDAIIAKTGKMQTFHDFFLRLVKGEHIVAKMDSRKKMLSARMKKGITKIFSDQITEGVTYVWAMMLFEQVQDIVMNHEALLEKGYAPHEDVDFEFVNSHDFILLAEKTGEQARGKKSSTAMLDAFVHLFREWYNERVRD